MKKIKDKIIYAILIIIYAIVISNILYSYLQSREFKRKVRESDSVTISACFLTNTKRSVPMVTLDKKERINELADNMDFYLWSSPLDVLMGNSYMLTLSKNGVEENLFLRYGFRLKHGFMFQPLRRKSASYFIDLAESGGVSSEEAFTKIIKMMEEERDQGK